VEAPACTDAVRAEVARHAKDADRRLAAIAGIREEAILVELALRRRPRGDAARRRGVRPLARGPACARRGGQEQGDRGVARLARQRLDAMKNREGQATEAERGPAQLEALAGRPAPSLTAVVELNRRWQALDMSADSRPP